MLNKPDYSFKDFDFMMLNPNVGRKEKFRVTNLKIWDEGGRYPHLTYDDTILVYRKGKFIAVSEEELNDLDVSGYFQDAVTEKFSESLMEYSKPLNESNSVSIEMLFEFFTGEIYDGDVPSDVMQALEDHNITWQAFVNPVVLDNDAAGFIVNPKRTGAAIFNMKVAFLLKKYKWA